MNVANILAVADAIEAESVCRFNMGTYGDTRDCGTAACIAGTAFIMQSGKIPPDSSKNATEWFVYCGLAPIRAAEFFDINREDAHKLFVPWDNAAGMVEVWAVDISPAWAARTLRNFAITGKVDWVGSKAENNPPLPEAPEREIVKSDLKESV